MAQELMKFKTAYEKFYIERFLYSNAELESKTKQERMQQMKTMLEAYNYLIKKEGRLNLGDIKKISKYINTDKINTDFRKVNVTAGLKAGFNPADKSQIIPRLNDLLYHYYNIWDNLDLFEKEARFHITYMRIHPFEDGNKRSGKLILATNLCKQGKAPIIITKNDTDFYYKLINECDYEGFADFIKNRSQVEDNTMCGFYKAQNNIDVLDDIEAKQLRKSLIIK